MQVFLLVSASQAFLLNLCIFWCTTTNSPLATTVTGAAPRLLAPHWHPVRRLSAWLHGWSDLRS